MSRSILSFFNNWSLYQSTSGVIQGLNNCLAKKSRKAMHFYALNGKIHNILISLQKDLKTDWERIEY